MPTTSDFVTSSISDHVGHIVLNRPDKLNALTEDTYVSITRLLDEFDQEPSVRVVVLEGEGRAFSAGYDLGIEKDFTGGLSDRYKLLNDVANGSRWKIWDLSKPVVAKLQGFCLGGAFELVLPTDFTIAGDSCQMGVPEILFGSGTGFNMVPWITGPKAAKGLLMTGLRVTGPEAAARGLVTKSVPDDQLDAEVNELCAHLVSLPPEALRATKRGINRVYDSLGLRASIDSGMESALLLSAMLPDRMEGYVSSIGAGRDDT